MAARKSTAPTASKPKPARKPATRPASKPKAAKRATPKRRASSPKSKPAAKTDAPRAAATKTVRAAVQRYADGLKIVGAPGAEALIAMALELARQMDSRRNSATSKSMCARVLLDTMSQLRELVPAEEQPDGISEFEERLRAKRDAAAS